MNDLDKIIAECYSIIHMSVKVQKVADDYVGIVIPHASEDKKEMLRDSLNDKLKLIKETTRDLSKISEKLADYCNNVDIVDADQDVLVQKFFELKYK